jgi:hypothetical protein
MSDGPQLASKQRAERGTTHIRPFRAYSTKMVRLPNGGTFPVVDIKVSSAVEIKRLSKQGNVIQEAEIRDWWSRFKKATFQLDDAEVRKLVWILNLMRVTVHAEDAAPLHLESAARRVETCVSQLSIDLPTLIDAHRRYDGQMAHNSVMVFERLLSAVVLTTDYLKVARGTSRKPQGNSAPWHGDAIFLALIIEQAAERAGKPPPSFTKDTAPAVIFLDEALTRAGVEHGDVAAIAQALNRYKRKRKADVNRFPLV